MDLITRLALKSRLLHVLMIGITLCFLVVSLFYTQTQRESYHREMHHELHSTAYLTEASMAAALAYGANWVSETLLTDLLQHNHSLDALALFLADGTLYDYEARGTALQDGPPPFRLEGDGHESGYHEYYAPIRLGGNSEPVGVLYMRSDMSRIEAAMFRFYLAQGVALLVILLLTFSFGRKLQRVISDGYQHQQHLLEAQVEQRTRQLRQEVGERKQTEQLLQAEKREHLALIEKLEQTQNQLLQSEKMASIGQLAAGVAHEINNPVGFISSNLNSLQGYVDDLTAILEAYGEADGVLVAHPELARRIGEVKASRDMEFLLTDLNDLLTESREGVERVKKIVQDLKDFSRSDSKECQYYDLHQGIESTLNMANNEIKYKAEVVREFSELPLVWCCLSQINQVVLNLLVNAAQSIEQQGTITVRTGLEGDKVWIEVEDTGTGIPAKDCKRIFEPFFTTKPVGKGTGLGLSLSYGIVRDHGGSIEVHSEPGVGTRFRVWLPREEVQAPVEVTPAAGRSPAAADPYPVPG